MADIYCAKLVVCDARAPYEIPEFISARVAVPVIVSTIAPPIKLCTDNAAMIAWAGIEKFKLDPKNNRDISPRSRWELTEFSSSL